MSFELSKESRTLLIHHFDSENVYTNSVEVFIQAGEGLPAQSTNLPLPELAEGKKAVFTKDGWLLKEDYRGLVVYDKLNCVNSKIVSQLGAIEDGWTLKIPQSRFDEWINGAWVTNESNKYIAEYNQVDDARRAAYFQMVTPLIDEAKIKRDLINTPESIAEAEQLEQQALAARLKIQSENPWPTPPSN